MDKYKVKEENNEKLMEIYKSIVEFKEETGKDRSQLPNSIAVECEIRIREAINKYLNKLKFFRCDIITMHNYICGRFIKKHTKGNPDLFEQSLINELAAGCYTDDEETCLHEMYIKNKMQIDEIGFNPFTNTKKAVKILQISKLAEIRRSLFGQTYETPRARKQMRKELSYFN
jgi:hypothetical protein